MSLDDAAKLAASFPRVIEGARYGNRTWLVGEGTKAKAFAWARPFSKADVKRFVDAGESPPAGDIMAIAVADLLEKEAALESNPKAFFDIAHFKGYPAFLVQLSKVSKKDLKQALATAYRSVIAR